MSLDFENMNAHSIHQLDPNDSVLVKQLGLDALPDYSNMPATERYKELKSKFIKTLLMQSVLEYQKEQIFELLKQCPLPENTNDDDSVEQGKKPAVKKSSPSDSDDSTESTESNHSSESSESSEPVKPSKSNEADKPTKPMTNYQQFISMRMKELREEKPNLRNCDYMQLAAKDWSKAKQGPVQKPSKAIKYPTPCSSESSKSEDGDNSESSDSDKTKKPVAKQPASKSPTVYQEFISLSIQHHKKTNPKLSNMQCMKLAAEDWGQFKNCMTEQLTKKKESNPNLSERECQSLLVKDYFDAKNKNSEKPGTDREDYQSFVKGKLAESKNTPLKYDWDAMKKNWNSIKKKHGIKIRGRKYSSESGSESGSECSHDCSHESRSDSSDSASDSGESRGNKSIWAESNAVPENEFVQAVRAEIAKQKELNPNLSEQQYTKNAIDVCCQEGSKRKVTPYQLFVSKEMIRQRQIKPKCTNNIYMTLAAKEWGNFKKEFNYDPNAK